MEDLFGEIGFGGAGLSALIKMFFRTIRSAASSPGAVYALLLYIVTVTSAMRAVTNQTVEETGNGFNKRLGQP